MSKSRENIEFGVSVETRATLRQHQIMQCLCKYPRITVGEVGRKTGLSKTYCFNLLHDMIVRGLVVAVAGRKIRGIDTRLYMTAFDYVKAGGTPEFTSGHEIGGMILAITENMGASQWYGYSNGTENVPLQTSMF